MTANEARQLTLQSKNNLLNSKIKIWQSISKYIFEEIEKTAIDGYCSLTLDLKNDIFSEIQNNDFEFLKEKLEVQGFDVKYSLERTPFGKREIIINWE